MIYNFLNKIVSTIIILQILFSTTGSYLLFKIFEKQVKKEIKLKIISGNFESEYLTYHFTYEEFLQLEWENNKEFFIGENIFDVINVKFSSNYIKVICYLDIKESNLRQNFAQFLNSHLNSDNNTKNLIFNYIEVLSFKFILQKFDFNSILNKIFDYSNNKTFSLVYHFKDSPTPPPKFSLNIF